MNPRAVLWSRSNDSHKIDAGSRIDAVQARIACQRMVCRREEKAKDAAVKNNAVTGSVPRPGRVLKLPCRVRGLYSLLWVQALIYKP